MSWKYSGLAHWAIGNRACVSVVFSWLIDQAFQIAIWYRSQGYVVLSGGPAVSHNNSIMSKVSDTSLDFPDAIAQHNPNAAFTSRGCIRKCKFCIVPKIEGELKELDNYPIRPIVCDNNFLACSKQHFDTVIDKLKPLKDVDFNQGLDARLITKYQANRLAELDLKVVRLAWDYVGMESIVMDALNILVDAGFSGRMIRCYVLIGYNDTPEDALYRLDKIQSMGFSPNPMRYQPIDTKKKNSFVGQGWTDAELKRYMRYWSRQVWLSHIPFKEYKHYATH